MIVKINGKKYNLNSYCKYCGEKYPANNFSGGACANTKCILLSDEVGKFKNTGTLRITKILEYPKTLYLLEEQIPDNKVLQFIKSYYKNHSFLSGISVKAKCIYCSKEYTYNLLVGKVNMGACDRKHCILEAIKSLEVI